MKDSNLVTRRKLREEGGERKERICGSGDAHGLGRQVLQKERQEGG
jgi:hypothetical protein